MTRSSSRKALVGAVILIALGLTLAGCSSPGGGAEEKTAKMGEVVKVETLQYQATAVDKADQVGKEGNINTAKGRYIVVDLVVTNTGKTTAEFDGDMATLWDENDQSYELDLEASSAACQAAGAADVKNLWFGSLEEGTTAKCKAVFDVPGDVAGLRLELKSANIGSEERGFISLNI